jgi:hypothetical protein
MRPGDRGREIEHANPVKGIHRHHLPPQTERRIEGEPRENVKRRPGLNAVARAYKKANNSTKERVGREGLR